MEDLGINNNIKILQCLIHQEALCAKISSVKGVMNVVVKGVNFVLSRRLSRRQFHQLLLETENLYGDLLYFCNVRWLSGGNMLQRMNILKEETATFFENKNMNATEFRNQEWVSNLAFFRFDIALKQLEFGGSRKAPIEM